jgi:hypothetical protein
VFIFEAYVIAYVIALEPPDWSVFSFYAVLLEAPAGVFKLTSFGVPG